jgi:hypothetical protein
MKRSGRSLGEEDCYMIVATCAFDALRLIINAREAP